MVWSGEVGAGPVGVVISGAPIPRGAPQQVGEVGPPRSGDRERPSVSGTGRASRAFLLRGRRRGGHRGRRVRASGCSRRSTVRSLAGRAELGPPHPGRCPDRGRWSRPRVLAPMSAGSRSVAEARPVIIGQLGDRLGGGEDPVDGAAPRPRAGPPLRSRRVGAGGSGRRARRSGARRTVRMASSTGSPCPGERMPGIGPTRSPSPASVRVECTAAGSASRSRMRRARATAAPRSRVSVRRSRQVTKSPSPGMSVITAGPWARRATDCSDGHRCPRLRGSRAPEVGEEAVEVNGGTVRQTYREVVGAGGSRTPCAPTRGHAVRVLERVVELSDARESRGEGDLAHRHPRRFDEGPGSAHSFAAGQGQGPAPSSAWRTRPSWRSL